MTRAEAIKIIERLKAQVEWEKPLDYQVALEMAIEALKGNERDLTIGEPRGFQGRSISDGEFSGKGGWVD